MKHLTLSLLAAICCLLITFANCLDADQERKKVNVDQDLNCLTLIEYFEKVNLKKKSWQMTTKA